jgi:hypothetical protein
MRLPKKLVMVTVWLAAGCVLVVGVALVAISAFLGDMCANEVIREVASPDGKRKAVVFERDCGATTGFSTQASVLPIGKSLPNDGGNIFVADTNHGAAPSGPGGGPEVMVYWAGPNDLVLEHDVRARVFLALPSIGDVRVRVKSR